jgi:hypothetical protein
MKRGHIMRAFIIGLAAVLGALPVQAAPTVDYLYVPVNGVHEVKYFHGCWDNADQEKRPKVHVLMQGLSRADVTVQSTPVEADKPSTEMLTFVLKNMNASIKLQFRSNDGPHCQQGVHSIAFRDVVLHSAAQLK